MFGARDSEVVVHTCHELEGLRNELLSIFMILSHFEI
jgi:hypothetical protein